MKSFIFIVLALAVAVGIMTPATEPDVPKPSAAHASTTPQTQKAGLFEASPYKETQLQRRPNGHFYVTADVNGAPITFLVDTGASKVALSEADARAAGIPFSESEYEPIARTANGIARGKAVVLPKVSIEGKEVMEVEAAIIEGAELSLLGQSYLSRITGIQMNGDTMVLR
ncbi:MAG TPA: TIGR02281 family clan AA aspartic protease [Sphingomicrobium sp.]